MSSSDTDEAGSFIKRIMRKIIYSFIGMFLWLLTFNVSAGAPSWSVNAQDYQYQMALVGVINLDGVESTDTNDMLAAFIDGELRGVGNPVYLSNANRYVVYMNIYHHDGSGNITFKIYDASQDRVVDLEQTEAFEIQTLRGSTSAPVTYSYPRLSSESNFLTYNLPDQESSVINGTDILVTMPFAYDLNNLAATYTTSPLAKVYVNKALQQSGTTTNSYNTVLTYKIISADATTEQEYKVAVKYAPAPPQGVTLSNNQTSESTPVGTALGTLAAIDPDGEGTFVYTLVSGSGAQDNGYFQIQGNQLLLKSKLDYEKQATYVFRVKAIDEVGNEVEAILQMLALNENDEKPEPVTRTITIPENQPTGTLVHTVEVTDPDGPSTYTYRIYDGNIDGKFAIHAQKGEVRIQQTLDYEVDKRVFDLDLIVSDGINENHVIITFNVENVNDIKPTVAEKALTVNETTTVGTVLHRLEPTDGDGLTTFTYEILNAAAMPFAINPDGYLSVASALDYEQVKKYDLKIEVGDGVHKVIFAYPVQIVNENDEKPVLLTKTVEVLQNAAPGTFVAQLQSSDADNDGSPITYSIVAPIVPFEISPDGKLTTTKVIAQQDLTEYKVTIGVNDQVNVSHQELTIKVIKEAEVEMEIANVLTPNGDGYNDYWEMQKGYLFSKYIFRVFDMRGQEVFFKKGYHENFWNGTHNGKKLPSGTYIYTIQSENKVKVYKGTLTILH